MTSSGGCPRCRCLLTLWSLASLRPASDVYAANSLSVLDSKLSKLYQTFHKQSYGAYEPPSDAGYSTRNAFHDDGGYHTRTVPYHQDRPYPHDAGGYATRNAFHHVAGRAAAPVDDGYHTRTAWFPLYQPYQHSYNAEEPAGYATRSAFQPYRRPGGPHRAKDAHLGSDDDGYQTRTGAYEWLPPYPADYRRPARDPGGYATQNAFHQPYRSAAAEVADSTETADSEYASKDLLGLGDSVDEGRLVYRQFYSDDDDVDDDDGRHRRHHDVGGDDDDALLTAQWSGERPRTPSATSSSSSSSSADYDGSDSFHHQPAVIFNT